MDVLATLSNLQTVAVLLIAVPIVVLLVAASVFNKPSRSSRFSKDVEP